MAEAPRYRAAAGANWQLTAHVRVCVPDRRGYQTMIGAASLAVGPLVMAVGDLLHPKETSDISGQAAIIVEHALVPGAPAAPHRPGLIRPGAAHPHRPRRSEKATGRVRGTRAHGDRGGRDSGLCRRDAGGAAWCSRPGGDAGVLGHDVLPANRGSAAPGCAGLLRERGRLRGTPDR